MEPDAVRISPSQRRVLETLMRRGDATADELAKDLETTTSSARQHLSALRSAGLVAARPERGHTGRPADRYHPTPASEQVFNTNSELAMHILDLVNDEDPELVDRVFQRQRTQLVARSSPELDGMGIGARVAALTERLDAEGYLADSEETSDGRFLIHLHRCPIWAVADRYRQACAAELGTIEDLIPNAEVRRVTHKTAGTHTCTYEISPRA